jgi:hypothetical protein
MSEGDKVDGCACGIDTILSASNVGSGEIYTLREVELLLDSANLTCL